MEETMARSIGSIRRHLKWFLCGGIVLMVGAVGIYVGCSDTSPGYELDFQTPRLLIYRYSHQYPTGSANPTASATVPFQVGGGFVDFDPGDIYDMKGASKPLHIAVNTRGQAKDNPVGI